jgi:hypothetical protein
MQLTRIAFPDATRRKLTAGFGPAQGDVIYVTGV